ncbi:MAG: hypothetical protein IJ920_04210 [Paludibacteraceae bacterium]|nr:hypothetical protein [Paludibacteraceae bacterium]
MIKIKVQKTPCLSFTLGEHNRTTPIEKVEITWSDGISLKRLKELLVDKKDTLLPAERTIWNEVKDKEDWLYCYMGHIDDELSIREFYPAEKQNDALRFSRILRNLNAERLQNGTDIKLDFGKVDDQTIEKRIGQHFNDGDYLEYYRKNAMIRFPLAINPYDVRFRGDYIDALETILIKGHTERTYYRMGVCNEMKTENPTLSYPIKSVVRIPFTSAIEKEIKVKIDN